MTVVMLTDVEGLPTAGMKVRFGETVTEIEEVALNSTDRRPVSTRLCLAGKPVAPYGGIALAVENGVPKCGDWVEEVRDV